MKSNKEVKNEVRDDSQKVGDDSLAGLFASRVIATDDNECLGFTQCGLGRIGFVDQVNGQGAAECPDFIPTRHELRELARYWLTEIISIDTLWFFHECYGSDDGRIHAYAHRRLSHIAEILGKETLNEVYTQVEEEYSKQYEVEWWEVYKRGDIAGRDRLVMEADLAVRASRLHQEQDKINDDDQEEI